MAWPWLRGTAVAHSTPGFRWVCYREAVELKKGLLVLNGRGRFGFVLQMPAAQHTKELALLLVGPASNYLRAQGARSSACPCRSVRVSCCVCSELTVCTVAHWCVPRVRQWDCGGIRSC